MKQLFIALVVINFCLPLFQGTSEDADLAESKPLPTAHNKTIAAPILLAEPILAEPILAEPILADRQEVTPTPALQSKLVPNSGPAATQPSAPTPAASPTDTAAASCIIAGPFRRKRDAEEIVSILAKSEVDSSLQPRDPGLLPDYMVYVGPEASPAQAKELAADFAARNMDSHPIGSGGLRNAVSLGVFSRATLANELRDRLSKDGFKPSIVRITRNRRGFQVLTSLTSEIRSQLLAAGTPLIDCPPEKAPAGTLARAG